MLSLIAQKSFVLLSKVADPSRGSVPSHFAKMSFADKRAIGGNAPAPPKKKKKKLKNGLTPTVTTATATQPSQTTSSAESTAPSSSTIPPVVLGGDVAILPTPDPLTPTAFDHKITQLIARLEM